MSMQRKSESAYARAGVDIEAGNKAVELMREAVRSTYGPEVLLGIGAFGGLWDAKRLQGMQHPVLVASTDGVGTKTTVASALGSHETLGWDIVNHCVNDILVQGAEPLFFLDYVAAPVLDPQVIATIIGGIAGACREAGCAILGGETAEMPGVYASHQMDIVGTIIGLVERDAIIDGSRIAAGDLLIGLPSSGLHTNGFSLVRSIFTIQDYDKYEDLLGRSLGEALVEPHRSYLPHVRAIRQVANIKGLVHITGGGYVDNIPRILPDGLGARVERGAWRVPPLFELIERRGHVAHDEMYRVLNMGMGMLVVIAPEEADTTLRAANALIEETQACIIGEIVPWSAGERVILA